MKTTLLFLALVTALFSQSPIVGTKTDLYFTGGPTSISFGPAKITTALTLQMAGAGGPILTVSPLPSEDQNKPSGIRESWPRYHRPDKPQEITVTLWTKDGKKWEARWEEVITTPSMPK